MIKRNWFVGAVENTFYLFNHLCKRDAREDVMIKMQLRFFIFQNPKFYFTGIKDYCDSPSQTWLSRENTWDCILVTECRTCSPQKAEKSQGGMNNHSSFFFFFLSSSQIVNSLAAIRWSFSSCCRQHDFLFFFNIINKLKHQKARKWKGAEIRKKV